MNIVLVGMMGSGKSTVGKLLAERMGIELIDTDKEIERITGKTVSEIFDIEGEEEFRKRERKTIMEVSTLNERVIATGGGVLLSLENLESLQRNGVLVHLGCSAGELHGRVAKDTNRPLLKGKNSLEEITSLLGVRSPSYLEADLEVNAEKPSIEVANEIISKLKISGKIVAVVAEKTTKGMRRMIKKAAEMGSDFVELRLDKLDTLSEKDIPDLIGKCKRVNLRTIVTCRMDDQKKKIQILKIALENGADLVDADGELEGLPVERAIASHHDFKGTPELRVLKKITMALEDASVLKIACKTESLADEKSLLELLEWGTGSGRKISVNSMGNSGKRWRIVSAIMGSELIYCHLGKPNAEGQIALEEIMRLKQIWK